MNGTYVYEQDQLELHRPGYRFAKLELSWGSKPTVVTGEGVDWILTHRIMLCIHNHTFIILYVL